MALRAAVAALLAGALLLGASACSGADPARIPTPTGFATEEEAYAAAEQTYRAYIDALNARRQDARSDPSPESFLIEEALENNLDTQAKLQQAGVHLVGASTIGDVTPVSFDGSDMVELSVCLDSTATRLLDEDGNDVTPVDRSTRLSLPVHVRLSSDSVIDRSTVDEERPC